MSIAQSEERVRLNVEIPKSLDRAIEKAAFERDTTKRELVIRAIRAALSREARA